MSRDLQTVSLRELLPPSISDDPNIRASAMAIDAELRKATNCIPSVSILPRIRDIGDSLLIDLLAWQFHVDFYDSELPIETRRELAAKSLDWHTRKGTPDIVEEAVQTVFGSGTIKEWFEYGGKPYFFGVETSAYVPDEETFSRLIRMIFAVKNTRSWLDFIRIIREKQMNLYHAHIRHSKKKITIRPHFALPSPKEQLYLAHVQRVLKKITLYPPAPKLKPRDYLYIAHAGHVFKKATIWPAFILSKSQEQIYSAHAIHIFKKITIYPREAII